MATATGPKKRAGITDAQRDAAIERILSHLTLSGKTVRHAIVVVGHRFNALQWLGGSIQTFASNNGEFDLAWMAESVHVMRRGVFQASISFDELIDEAIDADAGAETWEIPKAEPEKRNPSVADDAESAELLRRVYDDKRLPADEGTILTEHGRVSAKGAKQPNGKPLPRPQASTPASNAGWPPLQRNGKGAVGRGNQTRLVHIATIEPNPFQPRLDFDEAGLAKLAETIKTAGMLQPITVREKPGCLEAWQIIDGERRLRAAKLAGFNSVQVIIRAASDEEMKLLALIANDERKDLNPIERALQYKRILEGGMTQAKLAELLESSQPAIANAIRLLELPEEWRKRVISREMSPSHAQLLLPFVKYPAILKEVARNTNGDAPPLKMFEDQVRDAVRHVCEDLDHDYRTSKKTHEIVGTFKPTAEQLVALSVIELPRRWGKGKNRLCCNTQLFGELQAKHEKEVLAKKAGDAKGKTGSSSLAKGKQRKPSPAQEKARKAEQAKIFAKRLATWRTNWLRKLCADRIVGQPSQITPALKVLLFFAVSGRTNHRVDAYGALAEAMASRQGNRDSWGLLPTAMSAELPAITRKFAAELLWRYDEDAPEDAIPDGEVNALAAELSIDMGLFWRSSLAGTLSEGYFELHSKEQLVALGKEWGVHVEPGKPKPVMIQMLLASSASKRKLPSELAAPTKKAHAETRRKRR